MTGKSTIYVDQDFRAQVLVYNMIQDIRKEADDKVSVKGREKTADILCAQTKILL